MNQAISQATLKLGYTSLRSKQWLAAKFLFIKDHVSLSTGSGKSPPLFNRLEIFVPNLHVFTILIVVVKLLY